MSSFDHRKYRPFTPVAMPARRWPDQVITRAPQWCAVDLRDGNQALIEPMHVEQKMRLFELLVEIGVKQIEVGFPAASRPDYDFMRKLIDEDRIPADVTVQVLTQAREDLIARTFEALRDVPRAIVHMYNSTSKVQREQVFQRDRAGIVQLAVEGARCVQRYAAMYAGTAWTFQYSPESFTGTELDFAVEVCDAVVAVWQPTPQHKVILNLPATVEMSTPNVFADQVEWFCNHVAQRDCVDISVHTHNDRGCAVAAAEFAVMAGADRVEGTLMGNGERTGNMDLITMAMNLYSQGVDPELSFADMDEIVRVVESCTHIAVHPRHPYVGELVYTAFSGSHQDAIRKCLARRRPDQPWDVAYLPIDPADLGRSYQAVIRINSQSGKGGVAYVLERDHGMSLPRWMQIEFSAVVQRASEAHGGEIGPEAIWDLFRQTYVHDAGPYRLQGFHLDRNGGDRLRAEIVGPHGTVDIVGSGGGAVEALVDAVQKYTRVNVEITAYHEHALATGTDAEAAAYVQVKVGGERYAAVDCHRDTVSAAMNAVVKAFNRAQQQIAREA